MTTRMGGIHLEKWSKESLQMLFMKSALWANGNAEQFLMKATQAYMEDISLKEEYCIQCVIHTTEVFAEYEVTEQNVVFTSVPTMICPQCGNREWDLHLVSELERLAQALPSGTRMSLKEALIYPDEHSHC
ncbi:hypothetical protein LLE49_25165 [Alicyclobacillus tolerans]|uniref:hypothetical protein n=1 Tax=Alicyclobacillus tolerans TaxID=90970 RepID=UPI001F2C451E|nr:hypothetical protein [Alicyclobacillus tolerans]MCF8568019.1 hypothetical protein [Alicyclobacillus tolerans]